MLTLLPQITQSTWMLCFIQSSILISLIITSSMNAPQCSKNEALVLHVGKLKKINKKVSYERINFFCLKSKIRQLLISYRTAACGLLSHKLKLRNYFTHGLTIIKTWKIDLYILALISLIDICMKEL